MPNIIVVGRSSLELIDVISKIVARNGINRTDGVITYSPDLCCIDMTERHNDVPYLIVRHTNEKEGMKIARMLNVELNIDVEVEVIRAFLSRKGSTFSKSK
jgi:hypothetical protein